jgi:PBP1b-binding outer membrane lipoprotein LpoB
MKKLMVTLVLSFVFVSGCDSFRFAPTEEQKQNAYLHSRTTAIAVDTQRRKIVRRNCRH